MKSLIIEIQNKLQKKDITPELLVEKSKKIIEENIHANYVITNATDLIKFNENPNPSILSNIPYSLKDLIITKNIKTTGGMKFYEDFIPPYDSTVAKLLNSCGALLVSKDNCDETGFGGSGCEGLNGPVKLSENSIYTPMGSSSGPVVSVALGSAIFSIGTDTADSIRRPACFAGVVGYKPSYGLISRYGVFSYASSCDTVGVIAKYVTDTAIVAKELMVDDGKDYSIRSLPTPLHSPEQKTAITFSVIEGIEEYLTPQVKELYLKSLEVISLKFKVVKKPLNKNLLACIPALYSIVCFSEGATNHALDTGVQVKTKFSSQEKTYEQNLIANRTNGYSDNLKRRMVLGY
jgi:aspartyl-tRNA(Asn)/glutamyl-tRNA(Gln) amidotransferase subunit A